MMASQNITLASLADDVLELEDNGGSIWPTYLIQPGIMAFINEYHIGELHFLVLSHPFQCFSLVPLVKR